MDSSIITALAALGGTVVGGLVTFVTSFILKKAEWKEQRLNRELAKREQIYSEFLAESGGLLLRGVSDKVSDPKEFRNMYTLLGKIRMCGTQEVIDAGERLVMSVLHYQKKMSESSDTGDADGQANNNTFSTVCRAELDTLRRQG